MHNVSVVIPSLNQGEYIEQAINSVLQQQGVQVELIVVDGGSSDETLSILRKYNDQIYYWQSQPDLGQSNAINFGVGQCTNQYVMWLNSDDCLFGNGLALLSTLLDENPNAPFVYANVNNYSEFTQKKTPVWVESFAANRLAVRCIISQPGTLIRRSCWEAVGGLDESLHMAMDYDLWWRLYKRFGPPVFLDETVAVNREHSNTKTRRFRFQHYQEAIKVVRTHNGKVPMKWWLAQPYSVWFKALLAG